MATDLDMRLDGPQELSERHHQLWVLTILATVCGTDAQRRAFSAGYNHYPLTPGASMQMRKNHELGAEVHAVLNPPKAPSRA